MIALVCASFLVLSATVTGQRLTVTSYVNQNFRASYDILVRPANSRTGLEQSEGVVRPNFLSSAYGGITLDQVAQVRGVPGIDVAAPVAVLGQSPQAVDIAIPVAQLLRTRDHVLLRFALKGFARNRSGVTVSNHGYLYLTKYPTRDDSVKGSASAQRAQIVEDRPTGPVVACLLVDGIGVTNFEQRCWSAQPGSAGEQSASLTVTAWIPLTVVAVDMAAEDRLLGLAQAVTSGRLATSQDAAKTADHTVTVPGIMASSLPFDLQASVSVEELPESTTAAVLSRNTIGERESIVAKATAVSQLTPTEQDLSNAYVSTILPQALSDGLGLGDTLWQPSDIAFGGTSPLTPAIATSPQSVWTIPSGIDADAAPPTAPDTSYRTVNATSRTDFGNTLSVAAVGTFDPSKVAGNGSLMAVPLETYTSERLTGANTASQTVLGNKDMLSDGNPGGYVQQPASALVDMSSLPSFWGIYGGLNQQAPVGAIRVRVAGITGVGPVDRERIRQVADQIATETGLDVDITIGSSPQEKLVSLPATASGTPALLLKERWTKKGVAVAIVNAIDTKSGILSLLVLVSCLLTVGLLARSSIRARRRELGTLACIGWSGGALRLMAVIELVLLGLVGGCVGGVAAWIVGMLAGTPVSPLRAVLAVPLGIALVAVAGLSAMLDAGRQAPTAMFVTTTTPRRGFALRVRGPLTLGIAFLQRSPWNSVQACLAAGLAAASNLVLLVASSEFRGQVVGSLLGDSVSLKVRGTDVATAILLTALGMASVMVVLFLGLARDRIGLATLKASGWSDATIGRVVLVQGAGLGLIGGIVGIVAGAGLMSGVFGVAVHLLLLPSGLLLAGSVVAAIIAAAFPAVWTMRHPIARALAAE